MNNTRIELLEKSAPSHNDQAMMLRMDQQQKRSLSILEALLDDMAQIGVFKAKMQYEKTRIR